MVEQPIRNRQVASSTLALGSTLSIQSSTPFASKYSIYPIDNLGTWRVTSLYLTELKGSDGTGHHTGFATNRRDSSQDFCFSRPGRDFGAYRWRDRLRIFAILDAEWFANSPTSRNLIPSGMFRL